MKEWLIFITVATAALVLAIFIHPVPRMPCLTSSVEALFTDCVRR